MDRRRCLARLALAATTAKICDRSNSTARDVARVGYVFAPEVNILNMIHQNSLVKRSSPFLPLGLGGEQQDYSVFALIFDRCVAAIAEWFVPRCATSANGHTVADFVLITVR